MIVPFTFVFLLLLTAVLFLVGINQIRRWLGLRREQAFLLTVVSLLGAAALGGWEFLRWERMHLRNDEMTEAWLAIACRVLLVLFAVPFVVKVYGAWLGPQATPAEKAPGAEGLRAWLSPAKVVLAVLISACITGAYGFQFPGVLALLIGCLLAQPLVSTLNAPQPAAGLDESFSAEREKVLSLLENGRITAEESADLLNALGSTAQPTFSVAATRVSPRRRMVLIGAGLLLLAFFLPWFSINPGKEHSHLTGEMREMIEGFPMAMDGSRMPLSGLDGFKTPTLHVSGGDVAHGLGWLTLLLGLGTAVLPYAAGDLDSATRRTLSMIALGIGSIVLVYLVSQNLRFLNIGLPLAMAGYVLEFLGVLDPRPATVPFARAESQPTH